MFLISSVVCSRRVQRQPEMFSCYSDMFCCTAVVFLIKLQKKQKNPAVLVSYFPTISMMLVVGHSITALSPSKGDDTHRGFVPLIYPLTKTFKNATGHFFFRVHLISRQLCLSFLLFCFKKQFVNPPPPKKKKKSITFLQSSNLTSSSSFNSSHNNNTVLFMTQKKQQQHQMQ